MGDKQASFRTTISVPSALKARMDEVAEAVNWSAVACRAFEEKLAEIAARKEKKAMNDVIKRLKATLHDDQGAPFLRGFEVGRTWAEDKASPHQLARLERFLMSSQSKPVSDREKWYWLDKSWLDLVIIFEDNKNKFAPGRGVSPSYAAVFWRDLLGDDQVATDGDFLRGFVEGAVEIWIEAKAGDPRLAAFGQELK